MGEAADMPTHVKESARAKAKNVGNPGRRAGVFKEMLVARRKALDSLARYKFMQFGYWAAWWVHLNRIDGGNTPNPFQKLVKAARGEIGPDGN